MNDMAGKIKHLITCGVLLLAAGCATNPLTGKSELMFFPENQDLELGRQYAPELEKQMAGRIPDEALQSYVTQVGLSVAKVSQSPQWEYEFIAVQDPMINAFALPGGKIFITRGMLEKLSSEAQLAAILGHEVAHVVARDTTAAMSRDIGLQLLLTAAASQTSAQGAGTLAQLTGQIIGLSYSRGDERQADLAGLDYTVKAGYNPYGMVETMEMLAKLTEGSERPPEFFSTHPNPENRVGYLTSTIERKYYGLPDRRVGREDYQRIVSDTLKRIPPPPKQDQPTQ